MGPAQNAVTDREGHWHIARPLGSVPGDSPPRAAMATTKPTPPKPSEQDDAVNEGPPKLPKMTALIEDALVVVARDALSANRELTAQDQQGRLWTFTPDNETGVTALRVSATFGRFDLGTNLVPSSQLQCEAGDALLRSVFASIAGSK